jgi:uncharacterized membrane protein
MLGRCPPLSIHAAAGQARQWASHSLKEAGMADMVEAPLAARVTDVPLIGTPSAAAPPAAAGRIQSLDVIRGVVMLLMAIDHVRVYSGQPAGGPTAAIFFTRWITHFAAPAFCFFAGTSAFLHGRKLGDVGALRRYLAGRGALLIVLELTLIRVAWTFNLDFAHYVLAGVIWMLGWCMLALAGLLRVTTRARVIGAVGVAVIFAQQLLALPARLLPGAEWLWQVLWFGGRIRLGADGPTLFVLYSLVPWVGVMAAGYAFGAILLRPADERRRLCLRIGLAATALFVAAAGIATALAPADPDAPPMLFRLLGQQKYPASQLFLLMTLGPTIALLPFAERARGWGARALAVFGRVPMFYYLLHIPLIHALAIVVSLVREGAAEPWLFGNHPMNPPPQPPGYMWSLGLLYLVFAIAVALLYPACRWYGGVRARHPRSWLRFI